MNIDELKYKEAKKRVKKKKGFYSHLIAYLAVNSVLGFLILFTEGEFAGFVPGLFWGIGLAIHYVTVFGFPGSQRLGGMEWEQEEIERELVKMNAFDDHDDDLELNDELELREVRKSRNRLDDSELV